MSLFGPSFGTIRRAALSALKEYSEWRHEDIVRKRSEKGEFIRVGKPREVLKQVRPIISTFSDPNEFPTNIGLSSFEKVWETPEERVPYTLAWEDRYSRKTGKYLGSEKMMSFEGKVYVTYTNDARLKDLTPEELAEYQR